MSETIELIDLAEVKDGKAIVAYNRTEAAIAELRQKYQGAKYDLTTTAGDKAARAGRLELVTLRTTLEKKRKELKAPAVEFGRKIDSEAARLTTEIQALEAPIDAQIKADEKRREDERRAREEAEAARKKVHTDAISRLAGYVAQAADLSAARLAGGIAMLEAFDLSGFEEYTTEATETRDRTLAALRALHVKAQAREAEEARLQAERAEQARIAAEQAEQARQLKAQQDELNRQRADLEAREAEARRQQQEHEAAERREREEQEAAARAEELRQAALRQAAELNAAASAAERALEIGGSAVLPPGCEQPVKQQHPAAPADNVHPLPAREQAHTAPSLRLGEINKRLSPLSIDAAGLAFLGFPPVNREGNAKLYHERDFSRICAAIAAHVDKCQQRKAA